jgi:hypothetical protein
MSRLPAFLVGILLAAAAQAATVVVPFTAQRTSIAENESRLFSAQFADEFGNPMAGLTAVFTTDFCGAFTNGTKSFTTTTDAGGYASATLKATSPGSFNCRVDVTAGPAALRYDVVVYKVSEVNILVTLGTLFDGVTTEIDAFAFAGVFELFDVQVSGRLLPGLLAADFVTGSPGTSSTGQFGSGTFFLKPATPVGDYQVELDFRGIKRVVPIHYSVRTISAPSLSQGNGNVVLTMAATDPGVCGFVDSFLVDPRRIVLVPGLVTPPTHVFPEGFFTIKTQGCGKGRPVTFALQTPGALPLSAGIFLYGPTSDNASPHWHFISGVVKGNVVSFTLTDGADGDQDLVQNDSIVAIGGLAIPVSAAISMQDLWWGGPAENGWGLSVLNHSDRLFSILFIYDDLGLPTWYVMSGGEWNADHSKFSGLLYQPRSAPYTAYDVRQFALGDPAGNIELTFDLADHGFLSTSIGGRRNAKEIHRQLFGPLSGNQRPQVADLWWGGASQNGWGISIHQQFDSLFLGWFTYGADGAPTWFVMPSGGWTSDTTYEGQIDSTTGGPWLGQDYNASMFVVNIPGTYKLRFSGPNSATFDWTISGKSGSMALTRQGF